MSFLNENSPVLNNVYLGLPELRERLVDPSTSLRADVYALRKRADEEAERRARQERADEERRWDNQLASRPSSSDNQSPVSLGGGSGDGAVLQQADLAHLTEVTWGVAQRVDLLRGGIKKVGKGVVEVRDRVEAVRLQVAQAALQANEASARLLGSPASPREKAAYLLNNACPKTFAVLLGLGVEPSASAYGIFSSEFLACVRQGKGTQEIFSEFRLNAEKVGKIEADLADVRQKIGELKAKPSPAAGTVLAVYAKREEELASRLDATNRSFPKEHEIRLLDVVLAAKGKILRDLVASGELDPKLVGNIVRAGLVSGEHALKMAEETVRDSSGQLVPLAPLDGLEGILQQQRVQTTLANDTAEGVGRVADEIGDLRGSVDALRSEMAAGIDRMSDALLEGFQGVNQQVSAGNKLLHAQLLTQRAALAALNSPLAVEAEEWFRRGVELLRAGLVQKAEDCFRKGLEKNPTHIGIALGIGMCVRVAGGPHEEVLALLADAARLAEAADQHSLVSRIYAEIAALRVGKLELHEAREDLRRALTHDAGNMGARLLAARVCATTGESVELESHLESIWSQTLAEGLDPSFVESFRDVLGLMADEAARRMRLSAEKFDVAAVKAFLAAVDPAVFPEACRDIVSAIIFRIPDIMAPYSDKVARCVAAFPEHFSALYRAYLEGQPLRLAGQGYWPALWSYGRLDPSLTNNVLARAMTADPDYLRMRAAKDPAVRAALRESLVKKIGALHADAGPMLQDFLSSGESPRLE